METETAEEPVKPGNIIVISSSSERAQVVDSDSGCLGTIEGQHMIPSSLVTRPDPGGIHLTRVRSSIESAGGTSTKRTGAWDEPSDKITRTCLVDHGYKPTGLHSSLLFSRPTPLLTSRLASLSRPPQHLPSLSDLSPHTS